jgi:hypothetical protein
VSYPSNKRPSRIVRNALARNYLKWSVHWLRQAMEERPDLRGTLANVHAEDGLASLLAEVPAKEKATRS